MQFAIRVSRWPKLRATIISGMPFVTAGRACTKPDRGVLMLHQ